MKAKVSVVYLLFSLLLCITAMADVQDSILTEALKSKNDTLILNRYYELSETCETSQIMTYALPGIKLCKQKLSDSKLSETERNRVIKLMAALTNNIGFYYDAKGFAVKATEFFEKALFLYKSIKDRKGEATTFNNLGAMYYLQGDLNAAMDYYYKSLRIKEEIKDTRGMGNTCQNIADIYYDQHLVDKALEYTLKGLNYRMQLNDKRAVAHSYNNLARIYANKGDVGRALIVIDSSLKLFEAVNDQFGLASDLALLARTQTKIGKYILAKQNAKKALEIFLQKKNVHTASVTYNTLAEVYYFLGQLDSAFYYGSKGFKMSTDLGFPENIKQASEILSKIYVKKKNFEAAYNMQLLYKKMTDSLNSIANNKSILVKNIQYDYQKRVAEDSIKTVQERKIYEAKMKAEKTFSAAVVSILVLILLFSGFIFYRYRVSQKQKKIIEAQKELSNKKN